MGRARVLAAVVRILLALLRAFGFTRDGIRLPEGKAKAGLLRTIASAEAFLSLPIILRVIGLESPRYHAWRRAKAHVSSPDSCVAGHPGAAEVQLRTVTVLAFTQRTSVRIHWRCYVCPASKWSCLGLLVRMRNADCSGLA